MSSILTEARQVMKEKTWWFKSSYITFVFGYTFQLVSVATSYWSEMYSPFSSLISHHDGLFIQCFNLLGVDVCGFPTDVPCWLIATQVFAILGTLAGFVAALAVVLYLLKERFRKDSAIKTVIGGQASAALFIFLAVVIYGAKTSQRNDENSHRIRELSYSFHIGVAAMVFLAISAVLMGVDRAKNKPQSEEP